MSDFKNFLVPYDFSEHARAALFTARDLAPRYGANLHLVNVIQPPHYTYGVAGYAGAADPALDMTKVLENARQALARVGEQLRELPGTHQTHVVEGTIIADTLCQSANELGCKLIIMGTHGRTGLSHAVLGSVAERTLREADCPVLTVNEKVLTPA